MTAHVFDSWNINAKRGINNTLIVNNNNLQFEFIIRIVKNMAGHWSQGLLHSMNDPNSLVISTDKLVVIKDKFPKAKLHFLVLPIENIPSIFDVSRRDDEIFFKYILRKLVKSNNIF